MDSKYHMPDPYGSSQYPSGTVLSAEAAHETNVLRGSISTSKASGMKEVPLSMLNLPVDWLCCHMYLTYCLSSI